VGGISEVGIYAFRLERRGPLNTRELTKTHRGYAAIGYPACSHALTPPLSADTFWNPRVWYLAA
jgi:hypothetical protein